MNKEVTPKHPMEPSLEEHPYPNLRLNRYGKLVYANPASLPILIEWGVEVNDIVSPEIGHLVEEVLSESLAKTLEVAHGQVIIELTFSPSHLSGYVNVFGQDISVQKMAQQALIESRDEARTARKYAEDASKAKADFLAMMSHEIRTPMNGIMGVCALLMSSVKEKKHFDQLKIIHNCGEILLNIINDILDFSKIEAKKIEFEKVRFNIHQAIDEILQLLEPKAKEKNLNLSYSQSPSVMGWVLGDPTRFRQILTNLVSNAIKFTEKGSVSVSAVAKAKSDSICEFEFLVKDTGIGITREGQSKLFQSFSQADVSTNRKYGGTGLGLAISKGLCEKMGGQMKVESEFGKGSTFSFTLPFPEAQASDLSGTTTLEEIDLNYLAQSHPLRILVAEDNPVNQVVISGFLEKLGYKAEVVENGLQVLESLKANVYDLILMDCRMPQMDGIEATSKIIEKFSVDQRPKIVALTASSMQDEIERCYSAGMNDFMSKPIRINELVRVIKSVKPNQIRRVD